ncbi:Bifunctional sulfatase/alpha-L-rhamnosidase [Paenibacillus solanacearum]|uniref:Bifunctional sulfatase/alpha-L-rhamnosidase n=1 Tax=Paenibacillus solanacearum TaxID=2048548 RepID=A0A916JVD9_9BACL|nr:sulfatase-like hydrolase/transferase [Paenibacillus solanacearum]CAG7607353.1 Bifunctional sulfatase/alpha-L-rhamnosidase [Paenibacillus solanacearum]
MTQPNILFILSDDQGAWAMGCAGNPEIRTPNLDRLAATGSRFDHFFCTSPVCSPARASLLTGRIPSQHGVHDWIKEGNMGEGALPYLDDGQTAYTELLAASGYTCGISGKWHLGDSVTPQKGFTHWFVHQSGGSPYYDAPMIRDGKPGKEPGHVTEVITEDALAFIDGQTGQAPFYLSVHYTAPHSPWIGQHPEPFVALYNDCPFDSCPQEPAHPWTIPNAPWGSNWRENLKGYFAAVTAMDLQIGRLIDRLEEKGLREQTLIVFMGDNGFNCGHHGFWGKGNGTFPQNMYDTSVKVPAIFSHPGTIPQATVCASMLSGYDVMPTLLEYAGLAGAIPDGLPGVSFAPLLRGETTTEREHVFIYDEYGPVRMVRSREWKYVHRYPYGPHELYDLLRDPDERTNLINASEQQERIARMKAELDGWFVRYADPARDGVREPVRGGGQLRLAGPDGGGKTAFL